VHPVEIVIEGSYLDVLEYLRALEALPWHFYWKVLELNSGTYPLNRVRIELSTLSMDKEWLGV
jgi:MSHA biogenesis protein MshJ